MGEKKGISIRVKAYPQAYRFLFAAGTALVVFILISVLMIFLPSVQQPLLRIVLPILLFLLGALWTFARLPWYLGFAVPTAVFVLMAFLRLDGVYSLTLLIGYVPLTLAGALTMRVAVQYFQQNGMLFYE